MPGRPPGGPPEQAGPTQLVHMAIVYRADNSITLYREGQPYGSSYTKGTLHTFVGGKARVLFGQRHPGQGISFLSGEIDAARPYDRALTAEEVAASFQAGPSGVSRDDLVRALPAEEARHLTALYDELAELRRTLKAWADSVDKWNPAFTEARTNPAHPLHPWTQLSRLPGDQMPAAWTQLAADCEADLDRRRVTNQQQFQPAWNLSGDDLAKWFVSGTGLSEPSSASGPYSPGGQFGVESEGDRVLQGIYPAGVFTHGLSRKHNGVLTSPRFVITTNSVSLRALGEHSTARLVIENYALGSGGLYPATRLGREDMDSQNKETAGYGQQCLLARRLVERGVRFVELTCLPRPAELGQIGNPWDQHGGLRTGHAEMAQQVDQPIAGRIRDLRARGLFETSLIVWAGEFGRTPFAQGTDGRDHNPFGFSVWLAGGGIRGGMIHGATDESGYYAVENVATVYDLWATVLHVLGVDHEALTYRFGGRDFRLTDVHGHVVREILS